MIRLHSKEKPKELVIGEDNFIFNLLITGNDEDGYDYCSVVCKSEEADYGFLVSEIIKTKYSDDAMIAIINNYLKHPNDTEIYEEFIIMQDWRDEAKNIAKYLINTYYERKK